MLEAVVFDFDGVIVNSEPLHYRSFLEVAGQLGGHFSYQEYLRKYVGYDDRQALQVMLDELHPGQAAGQHDEQLDRLTREKGDAFAAIVAQGVEPVAGADALIRHLHGRTPLAVASGATTRDIELVLGQLDLRRPFSVVVSADDVVRCKPDPQIYRLAVAQLAQQQPHLQLTAANCLAIEDTPVGIEAARGAGLCTLGLTGSVPAAALHRAQRVVDSLVGLTLEQLRSWYG